MSERLLGRQSRAIIVLVLVAIAGVATTVYILAHQRFPDPLADTYELSVLLPAADGVDPSAGQPVTVAGVPVGTISGARLAGGRARLTLTIDRGQLPRVYRDAAVALRPITPLKDLELQLTPGTPQAGAIPAGGTIAAAHATSPADLGDLLDALDADTRAFLQTLLRSVAQGTDGRGLDLRRALRSFGPTTAQAHRIAAALRGRSAAVSGLVSNLAVLTRAAGHDHRLQTLVQAGSATLHAVAGHDAELRRAVAQLPATLTTAQHALDSGGRLADELTPTLRALTPGVRGLPATLRTLGPFSGRAATTLATQLRPFAREVTPLVDDLRPGITSLDAEAPGLTNSLKMTNAWLNELAYNPPGSDEGFLHWLPWSFHNLNSLGSIRDAHGVVGRATVFVSCAELQGLGPAAVALTPVLSATPLCPKTGGK
ncbi:MlaD family protein [Paraconexibacter antarcticus]|uniref:MlaD family protein n=1 Tax=Paraconexibacter antarcticus TaxID=2949664 RepID=A0ABY5E1I7_9ACTN|nr:MlaD family protein [Paraconexibacter antarcticus]UTI66675.1 MlaD family protein [Paraconexibacter antarcticus]